MRELCWIQYHEDQKIIFRGLWEKEEGEISLNKMH